MIKKDKGYQIRKAQAEKLEKSLADFTQYKANHPEIDEKILQANEDSLRTMLGRINEALRQYEYEKKKEDELEKEKFLQEMTLKAQSCPKGSKDRKIYLTKLVNEINKTNSFQFQNSDNLPPDVDQDVFSEAIQQTCLDVFRKIDEYDSKKGTFLEWFNFILNNRFKEASKKKYEEKVADTMAAINVIVINNEYPLHEEIIISTENNNNLIFTVPLSSSDLRVAEQLSSQETKPDKARQVFLNTLALLAVDLWFKCIENKPDKKDFVVVKIDEVAKTATLLGLGKPMDKEKLPTSPSNLTPLEDAILPTAA